MYYCIQVSTLADGLGSLCNSLSQNITYARNLKTIPPKQSFAITSLLHIYCSDVRQTFPNCQCSLTWWRHQMETISALLAICAGNSPVTDEFPVQKSVTRSFDVFFDLRLNKRLSKQSWGWWFETLSRPLWRHCNVLRICMIFLAYNKRCASHRLDDIVIYSLWYSAQT